jgi:ATP-binding cassette, subfamily B, heavy metal transporter
VISNFFTWCKRQFYRIDLGFARTPTGRSDFSLVPPESFTRRTVVTSVLRERQPRSVVQLITATMAITFRRFPWTLLVCVMLSIVASLAGILKPKVLQLALDLGAQMASASSLLQASTTMPSSLNCTNSASLAYPFVAQTSMPCTSATATATASDTLWSHWLAWSLMPSESAVYVHIAMLVLALVSLSWIQSCLQLIVTGCLTFVATQTEDMWRSAGLAQFYSLPLAWHNERDSASVTSKISSGASSVWVLLYEVVGEEIFINCFSVLLILLSAIYTVPHLWWVFLLPLPVYVLLVQKADDLLRIEQKQSRRSYRASEEALYDGTTNKLVVKAFGQEERETRRYASFWATYHADEYTETFIYILRSSLQKTTEVLMHALLITLCIRELLDGSMSVGTVAMLITYQQMIFEPLAAFNRMFLQLTRDMRKLDELVRILLIDDPLADRSDAVPLQPLCDSIRMHGITFRYASETANDSTIATAATDPNTKSSSSPSVSSAAVSALYDVSVSIPAGKTTAIVGRSGAGKSTLLQLLLRFYDVSAGSIEWDGIDLRNSTRASLRQRIAVVQQESSLFNRTIRENIAYGCSDALTDQQVIDAAKQANIHDFIMSLPKQYQSVVGEKGVRLSGGQRQRLAIARALVLQPSLLIFDESTSSLDSESEKAIQSAIESLQHHITQVIVAHRLSTIIHADQIIVMDQGRVVGCGPHTMLFNECPVYRNLYTLQQSAMH